MVVRVIDNTFKKLYWDQDGSHINRLVRLEIPENGLVDDRIMEASVCQASVGFPVVKIIGELGQQDVNCLFYSASSMNFVSRELASKICNPHKSTPPFRIVIKEVSDEPVDCLESAIPTCNFLDYLLPDLFHVIEKRHLPF